MISVPNFSLSLFRTRAKILFDERELKRWLERQGCAFGTQKGSHLKVYLGQKQAILPMHAKKELKKGTVEGILRSSSV